MGGPENVKFNHFFVFLSFFLLSWIMVITRQNTEMNKSFANLVFNFYQKFAWCHLLWRNWNKICVNHHFPIVQTLHFHKCLLKLILKIFIALRPLTKDFQLKFRKFKYPDFRNVSKVGSISLFYSIHANLLDLVLYFVF